MATTRSYADACGMSHALDLVGERWAMHVVRELSLGGKRFSDLKGDLPGISSNVLSHRLDELSAVGLIARRRLPPPAASWVYELTEWGAELEPVLCSLGRWAARSPGHDPSAHLSVASFVLSLRTNVDAARTAGVTTEVELRLGEQVFTAAVDDGVFTVTPGPARAPLAVLTGAPTSLASLVYGGRPLQDGLSVGDVALEGDEAAATTFLQLFTLPDKATLPAT